MPIHIYLVKVGEAYEAATAKLDRAPLNMAEFSPHFDDSNVDQTVRAKFPNPTDIVIVWGIDQRRAEYGPIVAYEKNATNGRRYVVRGRQVFLMTDDELRSLPLPGGQRGPF